MMAKAKKTNKVLNNPLDQIQGYLEKNKNFHYNFEAERNYTVSSGSLLMDIEMGGGISPGIIRASGVAEGGKTSAALAFASNFQKMEKSMVIFFKAEGRLSGGMIQRAGIDEDPEKWKVIKSNVFEVAIGLIRELVKDNDEGYRYMFIIDSMDALVRKEDLERDFEDSDRVAGGSLLSSTFLKKMALALATRGHICFMISQVRAKVSINPYEKAPPKLTNASGGNALLHYSDWIFEFQERFRTHTIFAKDGKTAIGHWCKVIFRKTPNEKTGILLSYPIRYGMTNGKSVWEEHEIKKVLNMFDLLEEKGAWINVSDTLIEEMKKEYDLDFKKQHHGENCFIEYLSQNEEITQKLKEKLNKTLSETV